LKFNKQVNCPVIDKNLLKHLESVYPMDERNPADDLLSQKLVFNAGIKEIIEYLKLQYLKQKGIPYE